MAIDFAQSERFTEVAGLRLHSNEAGEGPALLCFHGGGPGANAWDNTKHNIDALAEHFHVILLDLPGYGNSDPFLEGSAESQDRVYARVMRDFLDARAIDRAHLYGTSMSGNPVVRFGLDYPDRTNKLILKSPGALGAPNLLSTSPPDGIRALYAFGESPTRQNMAAMMQLFFPRPGTLTDAMIDARFESATRNLRSPVRFGEPSFLLSEVDRLVAPVLVLWGNQDHMVAVDGALFCLAAIPNVRVHIWGGGTGHFVEWERTAEFNRLVTDFLLNG